MEVKSTIHILQKLGRSCLCMVLIFLAMATMELHAQPGIKSYTVKNNRMYIALGKELSNASIDSFPASITSVIFRLKSI